jgi:dihydrodipicolinate synthase/N-acetylneuraminate lyase
MAAVYSSFNPDNSWELNLDIIDQYAADLAYQGVMHVLVAGTTGESVSLS